MQFIEYRTQYKQQIPKVSKIIGLISNTVTNANANAPTNISHALVYG